MRVSAGELALLLACHAAVWVQEKYSLSPAAAVRRAGLRFTKGRQLAFCLKRQESPLKASAIGIVGHMS